jgi:hypothetical protein
VTYTASGHGRLLPRIGDAVAQREPFRADLDGGVGQQVVTQLGYFG